jgi:hypothetical protein
MTQEEMIKHRLGTERDNQDNNIIIDCFSTHDFNKFHEYKMTAYGLIDPTRIIERSTHITNVPIQGGLMTIFNLYCELWVSKEVFDKWKLDLKIKNQIIA